MAVYRAGETPERDGRRHFRAGPLEGIDRPAIGALFPTKDPRAMATGLVGCWDVGANMDLQGGLISTSSACGTSTAAMLLRVANPGSACSTSARVVQAAMTSRFKAYRC